ncbi:DegT/DnrJ/EryC1/StrS family aminotransferase [Amantichitinum ursilacus]|uniref:UDP-4-amino-4-deoxy-L-arabinose--oxoglutarate aminotransferase n=1 Tax=Amantichitinum ursilacus TaxID=857265 RepID=A0A0N1JTT0_9NEIS|nr:DegT/DnrJ/EryC1/StrS aminotransferase family protein [Amantichitinum ursilacus]KPC55056.1 UDP-4-amino-4-deoxy-L-arabinose--oxoglutarate aminotransferase [Amantichitinum ursilacus]
MTEYLPFTRPSIDEDTIADVANVLRSGWITSGPKVKLLEAGLSDYFGGRPVRVVNSATGAMEIALRLMGIGAGDEVITTPMTWVATTNIILNAGATPVLVDIDPATRNIDLAKVEAAITPRTKAILPVDLAGLPVDRDRLYAIAQKHGLRVLEDAAQSQGATWNGKRVGSFGDLCSISFHPNKNMTTTEGGALVLNNEAEAREFEKWRLQGVTRFPDGTMDCDLPGGKYNLTDVSAAVGLGQLKHLDAFNARRKALADMYFAQIDRNLGLELPLQSADSNWHMFQPLLPLAQMNTGRADFIARMHAQGIGVGIHYPALHLFSLYRARGFAEGMFPHAEHVGASTISLPLFPAMQDSDVTRVCTALSNVLRAVLK